MLDISLYITLLISFSLQNKTILNVTVIKLGGMWLNIFDLVIVSCMVVLLFRFSYMYKRGFSKIDLMLIGCFIFFLLMGIARQNEFASIVYNARALFYLIIMFWITKNFKANEMFFYKMLSSCAFLCSSIYFFAFLGSSNVSNNEYDRLVTFNLQIILLYIAFSIYFLIYKRISIVNVLNIIYGSIAIFTTQTRTLIIPVLFMLLFLILYGVLSRKSNFKIKISLVCASAFLFYFFVFSGFNELILNRFINFYSGDESTLDLRLDSAIYNYNTMTVVEKLVGGGFGREISYYTSFNNYVTDTYSLELYLGEYIIKYGFIGTLLLNSIFFNLVLKGIRFYGFRVMVLFLILLFSLSISGLSGYTGQLFLGMVLGIFSNKYIKFNSQQKNNSRSVVVK